MLRGLQEMFTVCMPMSIISDTFTGVGSLIEVQPKTMHAWLMYIFLGWTKYYS